MLSPVQQVEAERQLDDLLGPARGRVTIGIANGNRVRLGARVVFEATSTIAGRLVVLDINAGREVTLIYPNQFVEQGELGDRPGDEEVDDGSYKQSAKDLQGRTRR